MKSTDKADRERLGRMAAAMTRAARAIAQTMIGLVVAALTYGLIMWLVGTVEIVGWVVAFVGAVALGCIGRSIGSKIWRSVGVWLNAPEPNPKQVRAPWSVEQTRSLNGYQISGVMHPFTCESEGCSGVLVAFADGWHCPDCDYRQNWAHDWMADGQWRQWSESVARLSIFERDSTIELIDAALLPDRCGLLRAGEAFAFVQADGHIERLDGTGAGMAVLAVERTVGEALQVGLNVVARGSA